MSEFKAIRERLGATQQEMADALGCSQGNVSLLDKGQTLLPEMAKKLIAFAAQRNLELTMDHVYGLTRLPPDAAPTREKTEPTAAPQAAPASRHRDHREPRQDAHKDKPSNRRGR